MPTTTDERTAAALERIVELLEELAQGQSEVAAAITIQADDIGAHLANICNAIEGRNDL